MSETAMATSAVEVAGLTKSYGSVRALRQVDLTVARGEYFVLLGPSGGGKTTLLRLIGGFLRPTAGRILIGGEDVSNRPPDRRPCSMVFQSFALFPHMSVAQNIGYGLKIKRVPREESDERVTRMLKMVDLSGYEDRRVHELSGGQQQRVQLARSLVLRTEILLLDEPLAALDAKLRKDMCFWLKELQEEVGITFVHVTHNQEEAMSVADRLAIIAGGEVVETGTVRDLYERPQRRFTADFIGENALFDGVVVAGDGGKRLDLGTGHVPLPPGADAPLDAKATLSVRSERLKLVQEAPSGSPALSVSYVEEFYLGLVTRHHVRLSDGRDLTVRTVSDRDAPVRLRPGERAVVTFDPADGRLHLS